MGSQQEDPVMGLSDFDARYLGALVDSDELKEIIPGMLTMGGGGTTKPWQYSDQWLGQLTIPSCTTMGHSSYQNQASLGGGGRGPGRIFNPSESVKGGLGVPGRPGTGAMGGLGGRRKDLGTVPGFGWGK